GSRAAPRSATAVGASDRLSLPDSQRIAGGAKVGDPVGASGRLLVPDSQRIGTHGGGGGPPRPPPDPHVPVSTQLHDIRAWTRRDSDRNCQNQRRITLRYPEMLPGRNTVPGRGPVARPPGALRRHPSMLADAVRLPGAL